jgi:hypothetical protein
MLPTGQEVVIRHGISELAPNFNGLVFSPTCQRLPISAECY